jgi:hypothetical protein
MELQKIKMLLIQALVESKTNKKNKVFRVLKIMDNSKNHKNQILLKKIKINLEDLVETIII